MVLIDHETGLEEVIVTADQRKDWSIQNWQFSPDGNCLLFMTSIFTPPQKVFRYSTYANYAVYNIKQKKLIQPWGNETIQEASWSPSGLITWIYHGNIFIADWKWEDFDDEERPNIDHFNITDPSVKKITSDGCAYGWVDRYGNSQGFTHKYHTV